MKHAIFTTASALARREAIPASARNFCSLTIGLDIPSPEFPARSRVGRDGQTNKKSAEWELRTRRKLEKELRPPLLSSGGR